MIHEGKKQTRIRRTGDDSQKTTKKPRFKHVLGFAGGSKQQRTKRCNAQPLLWTKKPHK